MCRTTKLAMADEHQAALEIVSLKCTTQKMYIIEIKLNAKSKLVANQPSEFVTFFTQSLCKYTDESITVQYVPVYVVQLLLFSFAHIEYVEPTR